MNFELSEEHLMIRQAARDFAQNELKDGVIDRDSKCEYPKIQVKRMAELGFGVAKMRTESSRHKVEPYPDSRTTPMGMQKGQWKAEGAMRGNMGKI